jgi:hypothetical protein
MERFGYPGFFIAAGLFAAGGVLLVVLGNYAKALLGFCMAFMWIGVGISIKKKSVRSGRE